MTVALALLSTAEAAPLSNAPAPHPYDGRHHNSTLGHHHHHPSSNGTLSPRAGSGGAPAGTIRVGYRKVGADEAAQINAASTLVPAFVKGNQIGTGIYTSAENGAWPGAANSQFCEVWADSTAWNRVAKAWVPQTYEGKQLWQKSAAIDNYITNDLNDSWDPATTIRLSIIDGLPNQLQMLVTTNLLNQNGGALGVSAA